MDIRRIIITFNAAGVLHGDSKRGEDGGEEELAHYFRLDCVLSDCCSSDISWDYSVPRMIS